jgi:predicted transcriptional regulator
MPRKPSDQPNDVEMSILRVLWERGCASVREVHDILQNDRDAGYTSTLKMMQVMLEKGLLKRDETKRPQIYRPAVPQEQTQSRIVRDIVQKVFGGSAQKLVLRAVRSHRITPAELAEIRKLLNNLEGEKP